MSTVVKRDPIPKRRGPRSDKWPNIVREIDTIAPEYGFVGEYSPGIPTSIRRGEYPAFIPEGYKGDREAYMRRHYEVTSTTISGTRRCEVFIRRIK